MGRYNHISKCKFHFSSDILSNVGAGHFLKFVLENQGINKEQGAIDNLRKSFMKNVHQINRGSNSIYNLNIMLLMQSQYLAWIFIYIAGIAIA